MLFFANYIYAKGYSVLYFIFWFFFLLGLIRNNNRSSSSGWKPGATVAGMFFRFSPSLPLLQDHFICNHSQLRGSETISCWSAISDWPIEEGRGSASTHCLLFTHLCFLKQYVWLQITHFKCVGTEDFWTEPVRFKIWFLTRSLQQILQSLRLETED